MVFFMRYIFTVALAIITFATLAQTAPGIEWQKNLGGAADDDAYSIQQTADSGYIVAGYSNSSNNQVSGNHGLDDYWIVKLGKNGHLQWQNVLGGFSYDKATSIQQTSDSGYIVAGGTRSNDGNVIRNHGGFDYWIVKLAKDGLSPVASEATNLYAERQNKNEDNNSKDFTVYPNPAKDVLYIGTKGSAVFSFINSSGEILFTKTINDNGSINISTLPPGSYWLQNHITGRVQKVIIEK